MEQYLDRREPSAELKVLRKQEEKYRSRHVLPFFLATATVVYFATAVVFLVVASTSASVTALLISVAFLIATTFTQTLTRDGK